MFGKIESPKFGMRGVSLVVKARFNSLTRGSNVKPFASDNE